MPTPPGEGSTSAPPAGACSPASTPTRSTSGTGREASLPSAPCPLASERLSGGGWQCGPESPVQSFLGEGQSEHPGPMLG